MKTGVMLRYPPSYSYADAIHYQLITVYSSSMCLALPIMLAGSSCHAVHGAVACTVSHTIETGIG